MKKVLIISSSPRRGGNSEMLCREFERGAKQAGHEVEFIRLAEKKVNYCIGCYACSRTGVCFHHDDMREIATKVAECDVLVLATPVYFYSMSGQLKVFIDRLVPTYTKVKADVYLFATAYDSNTKNLESTIEAIRGCTRDCMETTEKGVIMVGGVDEAGDIHGRKELQTAFEMGKNC